MMRPLPLSWPVIALGYVLAFLGAVAAVWLRNVLWPPDDGSGGMAAFGDLLQFCFLLAGFSVVPTGLAWLRLKDHPRFWRTLSALLLAWCATGPLAVLFFGATRRLPIDRDPPHQLIGLMGVAALVRMCVSPAGVLAAGVAWVLARQHAAARARCAWAGLCEVLAMGGAVLLFAF